MARQRPEDRRRPEVASGDTAHERAVVWKRAGRRRSESRHPRAGRRLSGQGRSARGQRANRAGSGHRCHRPERRRQEHAPQGHSRDRPDRPRVGHAVRSAGGDDAVADRLCPAAGGCRLGLSRHGVGCRHDGPISASRLARAAKRRRHSARGRGAPAGRDVGVAAHADWSALRGSTTASFCGPGTGPKRRRPAAR